MNNLTLFFQEQLASGNFSFFLFILAFLLGTITSLSPCNLAILPLIIGYVTGNTNKNRKILILQLAMFVLGLSLIFTVIGIISALTGMVFSSVLNPYWILFIASIILILGLNMIGLIEFNYPVLIKGFPKEITNHKYLSAFIVGTVFALAATPCSTPVLVSIMAAISLSKNLVLAALMLFAFALGQGLIIILAGLFTSFLTKLKKVNEYSQYFIKIAGSLFILFSIYLYIKMFKPFFIN